MSRKNSPPEAELTAALNNCAHAVTRLRQRAFGFDHEDRLEVAEHLMDLHTLVTRRKSRKDSKAA
jgi:hypothetical protein